MQEVPERYFHNIRSLLLKVSLIDDTITQLLNGNPQMLSLSDERLMTLCLIYKRLFLNIPHKTCDLYPDAYLYADQGSPFHHGNQEPQA